MSSRRKSFLLHIDSLDILDDLSNEEAGQLFNAIRSYQKGDQVDLTGLIKVAFSPFKNQFTRDDEKYKNLCEKNRLIAENRYKNNPTKSTTGNQSLPQPTKSTDNDSKSDSDNDSDSIKHIDQDKLDRLKYEREAFEHWWIKYPSKLGKKAAVKSWHKIVKKMDEEKLRALTNHIHDDINERLEGLESGNKNCFGFDTLHPTTYLNNERYNDDI